MNKAQPSKADQVLLGSLRVQLCQRRYEEGARLFPNPSATDTKKAGSPGQK